MRRILTSLPYEKRIALPGAVNGLPVADSVRRTSLLPVADSQLDADAESASGRLVRCDEAGSLLADRTSEGYSEFWTFDYYIGVNDSITLIEVFPGYDHLEFFREEVALITNVYLITVGGNVLQEILAESMTAAKGVRGECHLMVLGQAGLGLDITGYYFR